MTLRRRLASRRSFSQLRRKKRFNVGQYPTVEVRAHDGASTVVIADRNGYTSYNVARASKRYALRFAVGRLGRRGTVWRLWANPASSDVYLASRHSAGEMKISLHESGDWRYQVIRPEQPKTIRIIPISHGFQGRIVYAWRRPEADGAGWIDALTIVLPGDRLEDVPDEDAGITWCDAPLAGEQVELRVSIVRPNRGGLSFGELCAEMGARLSFVGALQVASGDVAVVLALTMRLPQDDAATIATFDGFPTEQVLRNAGMSAPSGVGARRLGLSIGEGGSPRFFDLERQRPT